MKLENISEVALFAILQVFEGSHTLLNGGILQIVFLLKNVARPAINDAIRIVAIEMCPGPRPGASVAVVQ